jgi:hypothetical protein
VGVSEGPVDMMAGVGRKRDCDVQADSSKSIKYTSCREFNLTALELGKRKYAAMSWSGSPS